MDLQQLSKAEKRRQLDSRYARGVLQSAKMRAEKREPASAGRDVQEYTQRRKAVDEPPAAASNQAKKRTADGIAFMASYQGFLANIANSDMIIADCN
jgi:hypothetical protein